MNAPRFLSLEQVAELHRLSLELHGGQDGLRDPAAFAAAVYQPQNTWFYGRGDLYDVARRTPIIWPSPSPALMATSAPAWPRRWFFSA
jgi:hypothetical protein